MYIVSLGHTTHSIPDNLLYNNCTNTRLRISSLQRQYLKAPTIIILNYTAPATTIFCFISLSLQMDLPFKAILPSANRFKDMVNTRAKKHN